MSDKQTVFIICGVHNDLEYTKKLLSCTKRQSYPRIRTIIIDDGSTDGTDKYIRKYYPEVILLRDNGNLWWTGCLYLGVEKASKMARAGDFILTVNNDCTFGRDYIMTLVDTSIKNNRAIVGSLILDEKNKSKIYDAGIQIDWRKGKFIQVGPDSLEKLSSDKQIQKRIDTLPTKGTIYPIEVFRKIGNFDKRHFPHYTSDYEFACRAKRAGFSLIVSYKARIYNDIEHTGFSNEAFDNINLAKSFNLVFSRRSKVNIIDYFWLVYFCCPKEYKIKNYLIFLKKLFYGSGKLLWEKIK